MKKISIVFVFILLVLSSTIFASEEMDYQTFFNKNHNRIEERINKDFLEWIENSVDKEVIIGSVGYSTILNKDGYFSCTVGYYLKNDNKEIDRNNKEICFIKYAIVNDELELKYIDNVPQNYDKFMEKFEEYKNQYNEEFENTSIAGNKIDYLIQNEEINNLSNIIRITSIIIIGVVLLAIFVKKVLIKK